MRELTKEELLKYRDGGFLTVGRLKEILEKHDYPDDAIVVVERVEDHYYEGGVDISGCGGCLDSPDGIYPPGSRSGEWGVYLKGGDSYYYFKKHNEDIDTGKYLNKEKFPKITEEYLAKNPNFLKKTTEEELHLMQTQYHPVWSPSIHKDEKDILFLNLHY